MENTDPKKSNPKKEPRTGNATAASAAKIPKRRYTTSEQNKIDSFRKKLKFEAWVPGAVFVGEWRKTIGPAYPLLCVLLCTGTWETGIWRGQQWLLAEIFGVSKRTIGDWISRIKKVEGVEYRRYQYSIQLEFPPRMRTRYGGMKKKFVERGYE